MTFVSAANALNGKSWAEAKFVLVAKDRLPGSTTILDSSVDLPVTMRYYTGN